MACSSCCLALRLRLLLFLSLWGPVSALSTSMKSWTELFKGRHFRTFKSTIEAKMDRARRRRRSLPRCPTAVTHGLQAQRTGSTSLALPMWNGEFGMEMRVVVPWAFHLHQLCKIHTRGVLGSKFMYFFSDYHEISPGTKRIPRGLPRPNPFNRSTVHGPTIPDGASWTPPPFKAFFSRPLIRKTLAASGRPPLVVIQNKFNIEWGGAPINYFDLDELCTILSVLTQHFTVVYKRHTIKRLKDHHHKKGVGPLVDLQDKSMIRDRFPSVTLWEELADGLADPEDQNLLLFGLMASADHFLSVQGGTAVVGSYFGGTSAILIKQGCEVQAGDYYYFNRFSNASVRTLRPSCPHYPRPKGHILPTLHDVVCLLRPAGCLVQHDRTAAEGLDQEHAPSPLPRPSPCHLPPLAHAHLASANEPLVRAM